MSLDKTPARVDGPTAGKARRDFALLFVHTPDAKLRGANKTFVSELTIGRAAEGGVQAVVEDGMMSRVHFKIRRTGDDSCTIEDRGSTNGTFVNGEKCAPAIKATWGAVLRFGDTVAVLSEPVIATAQAPGLLGESPAMVRLRQTLFLVGPSTIPVLILGETGTGKEAVAAEVHAQSERKGAFVAVNCGAIPDTLAESTLFGHKRGSFTGANEAAVGTWRAADKGTLFLDEVGELPTLLQSKILRTLDSNQVVPVGESNPIAVDARVVSATNVDLSRAVDQDKFRRDLYARLAGYTIQTPPLRERPEDVLLLLRHFFGGTKLPDMSAALVESMLLHKWPMNVRELKNLAQRWLLHGERSLDVGDFVVAPMASPEKDDDGAPSTREELQAVIDQHAGNMAKVADHYGKHRRQVYRWLKKFGIAIDDIRGG